MTAAAVATAAAALACGCELDPRVRLCRQVAPPSRPACGRRWPAGGEGGEGDIEDDKPGSEVAATLLDVKHDSCNGWKDRPRDSVLLHRLRNATAVHMILPGSSEVRTTGHNVALPCVDGTLYAMLVALVKNHMKPTGEMSTCWDADSASIDHPPRARGVYTVVVPI